MSPYCVSGDICLSRKKHSENTDSKVDLCVQEKRTVEQQPTQKGQGDSIIFEETVNQVGVFNRYLKRGEIQNGAITRGTNY
jgi:hypothetical protein